MGHFWGVLGCPPVAEKQRGGWREGTGNGIFCLLTSQFNSLRGTQPRGAPGRRYVRTFAGRCGYPRQYHHPPGEKWHPPNKCDLFLFSRWISSYGKGRGGDGRSPPCSSALGLIPVLPGNGVAGRKRAASLGGGELTPPGGRKYPKQKKKKIPNENHLSYSFPPSPSFKPLKYSALNRFHQQRACFELFKGLKNLNSLLSVTGFPRGEARGAVGTGESPNFRGKRDAIGHHVSK